MKRRVAGKKVNNPSYFTCSRHGKKGYFSKREANRAARMYHPTEHMNAYQCSADPTLWHLGHLPKSVTKRGVPRDVACGP